MTLYADWKSILRYAWSVKLSAGSALFSSALVVLPFLDGFLPRVPLLIVAVIVAVGSLVCSLSSIGARVVAQPNTLDKP